jgi:hypothetical protein
MTLVWCIATKDEAVFFADSSKYYYTNREHHSWNTYEDFESDVAGKLIVDYDGKWFCMNKQLVFFMTDCFLRDHILKRVNVKTPLELATAIHKIIKEDGSGFSDAIVCGFADTSKIELYMITGGKLTRLPVPNCAVAFPSPESAEMVMHYINEFNIINFGSTDPALWLQKRYELFIENCLKYGNEIFNEINQKYPLILKPLHIAKLNRDGFVWLQHENKT